MSLKLKAMKSSIYILLLSLFIYSCGDGANHDLIIFNVNIIDMETGEILANRSVGIDSNRISAIYDQEVSTFWSDKLDGKNGYLIPGLWDMHAHFFRNEKQASRTLLANGVTGIREMWGNMDSTNLFLKRNKKGHYGPDIYSAGAIIDGPPKMWPQSVEVSNAEEARAEVLSQIEEGVDFIKVYNNLSKESFDAIAETATEYGVPFAGHIPPAVGFVYAAEKGLSCAEHMTGITGAVLKAEEGVVIGFDNEYNYLDTYDEARFDALCKVLVEHDVWLSPTLIVSKNYGSLDKPEVLQASDRLNYIDNETKSYWSAYVYDSAYAAEWRAVNDFLFPLVGKAHAKGVKILAGSDFPNPFTYPGFSLHDELELLVENGMSNLAVLQSATSAPAEFMNKTNDFGAVAAGKIASLVLLRDNPLEDISNTTSIEAVIQRGKLYKKEALTEMLNEVKTEIANSAVPYSKVFMEMMDDMGFQAALDSMTGIVEANKSDSLLEVNDMGWVLQELYNNKDIEKMVTYCEYLVRWFPESSTAHAWAGEIMIKAKRREDAEKLLIKALELDPDNDRAKQYLEELNELH